MTQDHARPGEQRQGLLKGVAWMMAFRIVDRVAGFLSILVLARLLLPEHFGVVALASGVVAFIELLASMGLDTILIQKKQVDREDYDTAWTIQVTIALICAVLLCLAARPASHFFHEARLEPIGYVLALGMLADGLVNIRIVDFRRQMRFDREFRFMATRRMVALVVTMTAAVVLRNEWALAIGTVSSRVTGMVLSYLMTDGWPRFTLSRRQELLGKSSWLFLSNVVLFARQRAAEFALGRISGPTSVGSYLLASDLANTLSQELVAPINRVALPDLAAQTTPKSIARRFDLLTGQLAIVLTPLCFGLSACADLLVAILFGPKWAESAGVLQLLALAGWSAGISSNIGVGFLSMGMYRANAWIHGLGAVILLPLLIIGAQTAGAHGAALAVLCANTLVTLTSLFFSLNATGYGPLDFVRRIGRPVVAATLMYAAIWYVQGLQPDSWPTVARLTLEVGLGAAVYTCCLLALWRLSRSDDAAEDLALKLAGELWRRLRRR